MRWLTILLFGILTLISTLAVGFLLLGAIDGSLKAWGCFDDPAVLDYCTKSPLVDPLFYLGVGLVSWMGVLSGGVVMSSLKGERVSRAEFTSV